MDLKTLSATFRDKNVIFRAGQNGLPMAILSNRWGMAHVYLHGAHVTQWQPAGQKNVLFLSAASRFEPDAPIRGGVPICWPWFGPRDGDAQAPMHGVARLCDWQVQAASTDATGATTLSLTLGANEYTRAVWPVEFKLTFRVTVGQTLTMTLTTHNLSDLPITVGEALHTYLAVGDVKQVQIAGLADTDYLDKVGGVTRRRQGPEPIRFVGETDRVYLNTQAACILTDPSLGRQIVVSKTGSNSTVVWNPWIAKAAAMPDFGDQEWPGMVCIETANAADNVWTVAPGQAHDLAQTLACQEL